ncbi:MULTISPECIES: flagellar biosynthesis anti-sigma factor FlgM [unclassified Gilliamella]|uniref:flagellar biosynthesis anti-sigma factor FlgM n=1 Tax=unclassified Gilliamella TaxID=2685620 RepID=UPI002269F688|nr:MULTISPECIES: flagellar biosynthesis anti-sigma factor FlgM [unclassified Gilliamella]MCX8583724.1 flagellar biosynthesis anti-sigma factor FlgM [Gilliamella sp. B3372]MCX8595067.1 flagellar biosynthesis anti-sigma factor FlgM [Gilliamella sp. B3367]MCX8662287.1 flagellar biosynthesis anti-sigma factor FlgM [Gilliamella sp. B2911]MCX8673883.1 flagellar biosynthesis anti-sigma factor FlgM [Gilliamella sp. B3023]
MSIDATKMVTAVSGVLNRINEQNKKTNASVQNSNNLTLNVKLSQNTIALLHSTENDIDTSKIEKIKQAITEGKLVINPNKIADEIIKQTFENIEI